MKKEEVEKLISQKCKSTQELYNSLYEVTYSYWKDDFSEDFLATFVHNCTIIWIADILNFQSYYVPIFEIKVDELNSMWDDYDSMEHIDYPDEYSYIDTEEIETNFEIQVKQHKPFEEWEINKINKE